MKRCVRDHGCRTGRSVDAIALDLLTSTHSAISQLHRRADCALQREEMRERESRQARFARHVVAEWRDTIAGSSEFRVRKEGCGDESLRRTGATGRSAQCASLDQRDVDARSPSSSRLSRNFLQPQQTMEQPVKDLAKRIVESYKTQVASVGEMNLV